MNCISAPKGAGSARLLGVGVLMRHGAVAALLLSAAGCGGAPATESEETLGSIEQASACVVVQNTGANTTNVEDAAIIVDPSDPTKASTNYGATTQMITGMSGSDYRRILLKFDLAGGGIPSNAVISSATLSLRMAQSLGKNPVDVHAGTGLWSEGSVTWNQAAALPSSGMGALQATMPTLGVPNGSVLTASISAATVQSWLTAGTNYGLLLDHPAPGRTTFGSSEAGVQSRPTLQVCYDLPNCSDGIQNQDESAIDCGGVCPACPGWPRVFGTTMTRVYEVAVDAPSGDVLVTGQNWSYSSDFGGGIHHSANPSGSELYVARYDSKGAFRSLGTTVVFTGSSSANVGQGLAVDNAGAAHVLAHSIDAYTWGDTSYVETFDALGHDLGRITTPTYLESPLIPSIAIDASNSTYTATSDGGTIYLMKHSNAGAQVWTASVQNSGNSIYPTGRLGRDGAGNTYVSGVFDGTLTAPSGPLTAVSPSGDVFVMKVDAGGNVVWIKAFGGPGANSPLDMAVDSAGDVWVTGSFGPTFGLASPATFSFGASTFTTAGGTDAFLVRLDGNGTPLWAESGSTAGDDAGTSIAFDALGRLHWTGLTDTVGLDLGGGPLAAAGTFLAILDEAGAHVDSQIAAGFSSYSSWANPRVAVMPNGGSAVSYVDASERPAVTVIPLPRCDDGIQNQGESGVDCGGNCSPCTCSGVVCAALDACHVAGVCDPATGACSNPTAVNGAACNDGNACSTGDTCQGGVCAGTAVVNGTVCDDGSVCTTGDACQSGVCAGTAAVNGAVCGNGSIAAGNRHTCAGTPGGGVKCWGANSSGALGDGTTIDRTTPVDVIGLASSVAALAAGNGHTCALTTGGGVKCWGYNHYGALGDGTTIDHTTPVDVIGLTSGVAAIAAHGYNTCALTIAGGVKCWGYGFLYGLANTPADVGGLTSGVAAIAVGDRHACALTTAGGVKCWGLNGLGSLGDGTTTHSNTPVDVLGLASGVVAIAAGEHHTCAITTGGVVKCWGSFAGTMPVNVIGLAGGVTAIAAGYEDTCAITAAGGVKCWGYNLYGELGDGTTVDRSTPVDVVGLASGTVAITAGYQTCARTSANGVKCWGANSAGQLGDGTLIRRMSPINVIGL